jgi:predicted GIY-YIG superfamily endonuclease
MESILVAPLVYVLSLEHGKYYVGTTYNLNFRYAQHLSGHGAKWTRLHKPTAIIQVIVGGREIENSITQQFMGTYGRDNVRGGSWCNP